MVIAGARALGIVATLLTWGTAALAQSLPAVNPRAFEFDVPAQERSAILGYWIEVFPSGSVKDSTPSLRAIYRLRASRGNQGDLRLDLATDLDGLADGQYVATLRAIGRSGVSVRSAPSEPFEVSGRANRPPPAAAPVARRVQEEPTPQSAAVTAPVATPVATPVAAEATPDNEPRSRWWTVAFVAGIVLGILVPFIF